MAGREDRRKILDRASKRARKGNEGKKEGENQRRRQKGICNATNTLNKTSVESGMKLKKRLDKETECAAVPFFTCGTFHAHIVFFSRETVILKLRRKL